VKKRVEITPVLHRHYSVGYTGLQWTDRKYRTNAI